MRRRMIALGIPAQRIGHFGAHRYGCGAGGKLSVDLTEDGRAAAHAANIVDHHAPAIAFDQAAIIDLAAGLEIKRILPELYRDAAVLTPERDDLGVDHGRVVADEFLLHSSRQLFPAFAQGIRTRADTDA